MGARSLRQWVKNLSVSGFLPMMLLFSCFLVGCSAPSVILDIQADESLNQDPQGQSYSVLVRLYQLKSQDSFVDADYQELLTPNTTVLNDALVSQEEFIVEPGDTYRLRFPREKEARYQGLVAFFRQAEGDQWRVTRQLRNSFFRPSTTRSDVRLKDNRIQIGR